MTLKHAQFSDDPKKISTKSLYPPPPPKKKIFIFLKTPKNIEIQNFEPPKNGPSLRMCENIRVPTWGNNLFLPSWYYKEWSYHDYK